MNGKRLHFSLKSLYSLVLSEKEIVLHRSNIFCSLYEINTRTIFHIWVATSYLSRKNIKHLPSTCLSNPCGFPCHVSPTLWSWHGKMEMLNYICPVLDDPKVILTHEGRPFFVSSLSFQTGVYLDSRRVIVSLWGHVCKRIPTGHKWWTCLMQLAVCLNPFCSLTLYNNVACWIKKGNERYH